MSLEVRPLGDNCNLGCTYCYEDPARKAGYVGKYVKEKVLPVLAETTEFWSLFGGEALLLPLADLEELLALGFSQFQKTGVQTNGSMITERHLALFEKYHTEVGFSIDGPGELNDARWAHTLTATRAATERSIAALHSVLALAAAQRINPPSLIVTLHAQNIGTPDRQERLLEWFHELDARGLRSINLHAMELDAAADGIALPLDDQLQFFVRLWDEAPSFRTLRFQTFDEVIALLSGQDHTACCVWHSCDPWNTSAVQGLEGDGTPSGCRRNNKDGVNWLPPTGTGIATRHAIGGYEGNRSRERQLSLYVTPQEHGGCKDCRFWLMCKGQCPGTGVAAAGRSGDWRLRSADCALWKGLFEEGERRLTDCNVVPVSRWSSRPTLEAEMYRRFITGANPQMSAVIADATRPAAPVPAAGPTGHVNVPHTNTHGNVHANHTDYAHPPRQVPHANVPHQNVHANHSDGRRQAGT